MIDRYGNEIEADLRERFTVDLRDYFRPWGDPLRRSWGQLASWVDILDKRSDTYLSDARALDVDVYRQARDAGTLRSGSGKPRGFEWDLSAQIGAANFLLMQQLCHLTAHSRKKFQGKPWPHPESALDIIKREDAEQGYNDLMAEIVYVEQEEFERVVAEHQAEQDVVRIERE